MTFLIPLLLRVGIPSRFGKVAAWAVTALGAVLLLTGCVLALQWVIRSHDDAVATEAVAVRDKDLSLESYNIVQAAAERADVNQAARDDVATNNAKEIDREAAKGNDTVVGIGTRSVLERMREQQATGRR